MSMELTKNGYDALADAESRETLFLLGGAALMIFGAGLILSTPAVRRYLGASGSVAGLIQGVVPDFERYMKLRSM